MNTLAEPAFLHSWPAHLALTLRRRQQATRLARCRHHGPLYVQRPFYPEGDELAHLYLLHPPGGMVSGDSLQIELHCERDSHGLVTTPGAARIYRARDTLPTQRQQVRLRIDEGATLEWFPLETIVFDGACVELDTQVELAPDSAYIGWEVSCFGLPASAALFAQGSFRQRYRVSRDGMPLFVDALDIDGESLHHYLDGSAAMRRHSATGFFLAGPFDGALPEAVVASLLQASPAELAAVSRVGEFVVGRYLGDSAEQARRIFGGYWQLLRPLLIQREACAPRIWLT